MDGKATADTTDIKIITGETSELEKKEEIAPAVPLDINITSGEALEIVKIEDLAEVGQTSIPQDMPMHTQIKMTGPDDETAEQKLLQSFSNLSQSNTLQALHLALSNARTMIPQLKKISSTRLWLTNAETVMKLLEIPEQKWRYLLILKLPGVLLDATSNLNDYNEFREAILTRADAVSFQLSKFYEFITIDASRRPVDAARHMAEVLAQFDHDDNERLYAMVMSEKFNLKGDTLAATRREVIELIQARERGFGPSRW